MNRDRLHSQPTGSGSVPRAANARSSNAMMWRAAIFLAIFAALQGWYSTVARNTWIERLVIDEVTVKSAAALIQLIDPATGVQPVGSRLHAPGGGINIINGCEGVDVLFLMMAAMLVAPISLNARLMGIVLGICVVLTLNQARVIGLFYAYRLDRSLFDMLHGVVAPLMLIVAVSGYFLLWLNWHAPVEHDSTAEQ